MLDSLAAAFRILANTPLVPVADSQGTSIELDTYTVDPRQVPPRASAGSELDSEAWKRIPRVSSLRPVERRLRLNSSAAQGAVSH
ncbi:hypothetical protein JB92DRAFT_3111900 [Gautieria morchelliformis]|nr:hypothetical protein JB92DRAFT_3111900 [Gautieria morchelliformis]